MHSSTQVDIFPLQIKHFKMSLSTRVNGVRTLLGESVRHITDAELEYLRTAIGVSTEESVMAPPWKAMFTSKAVWAIIIAHFAENWGFYTLLTGLPMFMQVQQAIII